MSQNVPCREEGSIDQVSGSWFVIALAVLWIFMLLDYRIWKAKGANMVQ